MFASWHDIGSKARQLRGNESAMNKGRNMPNSSSPEERSEKILSAWTEFAPDQTFGGMTKEQFAEKVKPSTDSRKEVKTTELKLKADNTAVVDADKVTTAANQLVVNAIKGDPNFGEDSELYEGCGYIRKSDKASGLHRNSKTAVTTPA
jgi:hypothetical protein